jgi:hypothetical protein
MPYFGPQKSSFLVGPDRAQFHQCLPTFESVFSSKLFILLNIEPWKLIQHIVLICQYGPNIVNSVTMQKTTILRITNSGENWSSALPSIRHMAQKTTPSIIFRLKGNMFTKPLPSNDKGIQRQSISFNTTQTVYKMTCPTILLLLCSLPRERVYGAVT